MKKFKYILIFLVVSILLFWVGSILKCEILTYLHGTEFASLYKANTMIGEIEYLKVLDYSDTSARIYYVSVKGYGGDILVFVKKSGHWTYDKWERTVWSKTGSADGFVWPYIR